MSIFVIHTTHELHQLKKALPLLWGDMIIYRHYHSTVSYTHLDVYKRQEQQGVGIGLYLAREIVTRQGGYIKVVSEPGKGSEFSIMLPTK